eukprot:scaffold128639_cov27-Phaeocystis_antarctica.AAC.1
MSRSRSRHTCSWPSTQQRDCCRDNGDVSCRRVRAHMRSEAASVNWPLQIKERALYGGTGC